MEHLNYTQHYSDVPARASSDNQEMEGLSSKPKPRPISTSRKRSPKNLNNEEDEKKGKRGRPRVDPQDQSSVEVRQSLNKNRPILL